MLPERTGPSTNDLGEAAYRIMRPSKVLLSELSATVCVVLARPRQAVCPYICLRVHAIGADGLKLARHVCCAYSPDRCQAQLVCLQQNKLPEV